VDAVEKILVIDLVAFNQILERHLHQNDDVLALHVRLLNELCRSAIEHIDSHFGNGAKAAAFNDDTFLVKHVGRLDHLAVRKEHRRLRQPLLHQLKRHETIVDGPEWWPGELEHVDVEAVGGEIIKKRINQCIRSHVLVKGTMNKVDADDAQRFLLLNIFSVQQPHVDDDLRRWSTGRRLKLD